MPAYSYSCPECKIVEEIIKPLSNIDDVEYCVECAVIMKRIIVQGHGGTHGDEAAWIRDTNIALSDEWSRPIENRTELKKREKEMGVICIG